MMGEEPKDPLDLPGLTRDEAEQLAHLNVTAKNSGFEDISANLLQDTASLRNLDLKYEVTSRRARDTISERGAFNVRSRSCAPESEGIRSDTALSNTSRKAPRRTKPGPITLARQLMASNIGGYSRSRSVARAEDQATMGNIDLAD